MQRSGNDRLGIGRRWTERYVERKIEGVEEEEEFRSWEIRRGKKRGPAEN